MPVVPSQRLRMRPRTIMEYPYVLKICKIGSSVSVGVSLQDRSGTLPLASMEILPSGRIIIWHCSGLDVKARLTSEVVNAGPAAL